MNSDRMAHGERDAHRGHGEHDGDRLLERWQALLARQPHLHIRQAATALQVPEAALLASRVGTGAVRLAPRLREMLAGIEQWRKLFVVTPNRLGVSIAILNAQPLQEYGDPNAPLLLLGDQHRIVIDTKRVHACYLFEDHDVHGHSLSLCWFDEHGNGLGKLFLRSRRGQEFAQPGLMAFALPEQSQRFVARALAASRVNDHRTATPCDREHAARLARAALLDASRFQAVELSMTGGALTSTYQGTSPACSAQAQALHLVAAGCKLHLRLAPARSACAVRTLDGRAGLRVDTVDGSLSIVPCLDAPAGQRWLDALLEQNS
ncbi:MAG: hypothetical protein J0H09_16945 [Burkholderiales bacterium]|nr:hypothetical protein [Burkholderiales bacterium]